MERVLVICGGKHQIPLIKKAKSMGIEVVNTNLYENSPAFSCADLFEVADVLDKNKNLEYAEKYKVSGVISDQSEISVRTVAFVSQEMGLNTITDKTAALFTDKYLMRQFCEKSGFAFPRYKKCISCQEALDFYDGICSKMIIKPLDANSSKGVFSINSRKDIEDNFVAAQGFSASEKGVIIEEYIEGTEFTVDALVLENKAYNLAISEKKHYEYNENVANELYFSYTNPKFDYNRLRELNSEIIKKSKLGFGLTHSEYKYSNGDFVLIEMAARGGGAYIASKIVPFISGVDNYAYYINAAMNYDNGEFDKEIPRMISEKNNRRALLKFLDIPYYNRKITKIEGIQEILKHRSVIHFELNLDVGDIITRADDDSSRHGFYIIGGDSDFDIIKTEQFILNTLHIEYEREMY